MNNNLKCFLAFSLGAVAGSLATYKIVKTKCEQRADEEIESVKEMLGVKKVEVEEDEEEEGETTTTAASINATVNMQKASLQEYAAVLKQSGYTNYSDSEQNNNEEDKPMSTDTSHIEIIAPDEFDTEDGYEAVTLTYYEGDGVLTDEWDQPIEDVNYLVGDDFAEHYGEYEDDTVFVRNHRTKGDYEICRDTRSYSEVVGESYPMEG